MIQRHNFKPFRKKIKEKIVKESNSVFPKVTLKAFRVPPIIILVQNILLSSSII